MNRSVAFYLFLLLLLLVACKQQAVLSSNPQEATQPLKLVTEKMGEPCASSPECGSGYVCTQGSCQEPLLDASCQSNTDCTLINKDLEFQCCEAGACDAIDYSKRNWISVNKNWFESERTKNCPPTEQCGPIPNCPTKIVNENFEAKCTQGQCQKQPKPGSIVCNDLCGNDRCEQVVCMGNGCPCAENSESCPEDCD
ncbi:MAG: hypothetical protein AABX70_07140 [Nanoarchaeota archaeon]